MDCPDSSTSLDGNERKLIICKSCAEDIENDLNRESCTDTDDSESPSLTVACECDSQDSECNCCNSPCTSYEHLDAINDVLVRPPTYCNVLAEPCFAPEPFFAQEQFFELPQTGQEMPLPNLPQQQFFNVTPMEAAPSVSLMDESKISTVWQNMNYEAQPQLMEPVASTVIMTPKINTYALESGPVYTNLEPFNSEFRVQSGIRPLNVDQSAMRMEYISNATLPFPYFQSEIYDPNYIQPIDATQYDQLTASGFTNPFHEVDILNELSSPFQIPNQYQSQIEQTYPEATAPQYDGQFLISYNNQGMQNLNNQIPFPEQTSAVFELQEYDNQFLPNYSPDVIQYSNVNNEYDNAMQQQVSGTFSQHYSEPNSPNQPDYMQLPEFVSTIPQIETYDPNSSQLGTSTERTVSEDQQSQFGSNIQPIFSQTPEQPANGTQPTTEAFQPTILPQLNISPFPQPPDPPTFQLTPEEENVTPFSEIQEENIAPLSSFPIISQLGNAARYSDSQARNPSSASQQSSPRGTDSDVSKRQDSGQMLLPPQVFESKISYVDPVFMRQQREEERENNNNGI